MPIINKNILAVLVASALVVGSGGALSSRAFANEGSPAWHPQSSERLVKLPARYLNKSLDQGFSESSLGLALSKTEVNVGLKVGTLKDLQKAVAQSDGKMRMELRHQLLAEKRAYLDLMSRRNDIRREHVQTKLRVVEDTLGKLVKSNSPDTPAMHDLITRQAAARERFSSSLAQVDMKVFQSASVPESKYAVQYAKNRTVIEKLLARISNHKMAASSTGDSATMTKEEYLRQVVADTQTKLSLIDQEDTILGYMAKLVALDAMDLSEEAMNAELAASNISGEGAISPTQVVSFFLKN